MSSAEACLIERAITLGMALGAAELPNDYPVAFDLVVALTPAD
jgi:hypothetical protein